MSVHIYHSIAALCRGVGTGKIMGRVHAVPLQVGVHFTTMAVTVLEAGDRDWFLFGLDMLKHHQACFHGPHALDADSKCMSVESAPTAVLCTFASESHPAENRCQLDNSNSMAHCLEGGFAIVIFERQRLCVLCCSAHGHFILDSK